MSTVARGDGPRSRIKRDGVIIMSLLPRDGAVEPLWDPVLGQLVCLRVHKPVQPRGQWRGQLPGSCFCHGIQRRVTWREEGEVGAS